MAPGLHSVMRDLPSSADSGAGAFHDSVIYGQTPFFCAPDIGDLDQQ
jgi:hypothetical protein